VRVVLAGPFEEGIETATKSLGGFELVDVVRFHPTRLRLVPDRFRYEFDPRFLDTHGLQACSSDRTRLRSLMACHDLVWIHGLRIANGCGFWRWPNSVLDIDDIPSGFHRTEMEEAAGAIQKLRCYRQVLQWRRREKTLLERFEAVCVCSEADRRELGGTDRVFVVPNGFALPKQTPVRRPATPPRIGFVGNFQYKPNRQGIGWFINRVWPLILKVMPQTRLRLVGNGSENEPWRTCQNADGLGWIADLEGEMATWSLAIVPVFVGGGTRVKIPAAFSRKCPMVSTALGAYGYEVVAGRDLLIADSVEDFASSCLRILQDAAEGERLAESGWQKFLSQWTWDALANRVETVVGAVLERSKIKARSEAPAIQ
jgi:glycosyltransferase involved in cell wall biosynthesis